WTADAWGEGQHASDKDFNALVDPHNVPDQTWPATTAEDSHKAWPMGRQPELLAAWPVRDGKIAMCWQSQVLKDIQDGWPGQCVGLAVVQAPTVEKCRISCTNQPRCPVWQFNPGQIEGGCWQGQGYHCNKRNGFSTVQFSGGQRIQHGSVRVVKQMAGIEVHNLRLIGKLSDSDQRGDIARCRELCHSDILCQYWQYGRDGCQVEDPAYSSVQYPLTLEGGASVTSDYAKSVVAGEFIQHYCPPRSQQRDRTSLRTEKPDPLGYYANWRFVPYAILMSLFILMFVCLAFCVLDQKENALLSEVQHIDAATSPAMPTRSSRPSEAAPAQAPLQMQLASLPQRIFSSRPMQPPVPMGVRTPGAPIMLAACPRR
ncbi:unnamed protein product, partial [Cladocopium goreaui]